MPPARSAPPRIHSPQPPHVAPPGPTHTAIEIPYRLILSPDDFAVWSHASKPVTHADWTELWHTRLASRRNADPRVRAIWSPDFIAKGLQTHYVPGSPTSADPFRASLDARDRNEIVHLTSNHYIDGYIPSPVETEQFTLTSLGATVRFEGAWDAPETPSASFPATLTVEQWRHEASIGRDQFVKVVYRGFLVPFGHRASVVKITERRFYPAPAGQPPGFIAYLFQRIFIIVREPLRTYEPRSMPFRSVRIKTTVTPNLDNPDNHDFVGTLGLSAFWPFVEAPGGGFKPFLFQVVATDWSGTTSEFGVPLAFVDLNVNNSQPGAIISSYNSASADLRDAMLGGQGVTFAPSKTKGDTILETNDVTFGADPRSGDGPRFQPKVDAAKVVIPAVKQATGGPGTATIKWEPSYLANSGDVIGNVANVFAQVTNGALNFGSTERSGGLVAPDLSISGLSRSLGPIGGPVGDMVGGKFDPAAIFGNVKLLGGLTLGNIIDTLE